MDSRKLSLKDLATFSLTDVADLADEYCGDFVRVDDLEAALAQQPENADYLRGYDEGNKAALLACERAGHAALAQQAQPEMPPLEQIAALKKLGPVGGTGMAGFAVTNGAIHQWNAAIDAVLALCAPKEPS